MRNHINILHPDGRIEKISRTEAANRRIHKLLEQVCTPDRVPESSQLLADILWSKEMRGRPMSRKKRSDAGVSRSTSSRTYALRHRESLDIPGGWYSSPGRAITAFKTSLATCGLTIEEYDVVDDLQRVVKGHKKPKKRPIEYGLKLPDGTTFGWYSSANKARQAYNVSVNGFARYQVEYMALEVVSRGRLVVKPGMYAVYCHRLKHFWSNKRGKVWFKSARAAEAAWRYNQHNPQGWQMVRGKTADSWKVLECYVLMDK